jgi:DNA-binding NarL/FixJ family response regulator
VDAVTADPASGALRVVVVDDQDLVRAGFRLILERGGHDVVGEAADGVEAIEVVRRTEPDVVLMDVRMPHLDGIRATEQVLAGPNPPRVIVLTTFDVDEYVYGAIRAGACGYLLKDVSPTGLVHAVRVAAAGESMLAPTVIGRMVERFGSSPVRPALPPAIATLSERETTVARLIARGRSNAEIAADLFLSEATVKTYVSRLFTKLDARDRVQVTVLAYEGGLVRVGDDD